MSLLVSLKRVSILLTILCVMWLHCLFQHISLVKSHNSFLELFEVANVADDLTDIFLESLLFEHLTVKFDTTFTVFLLESLMSELHIFDDKVQVVSDTLEMFDFNLHLVHLLVEELDVVL